MIKPNTIESQLHCKATAELAMSIQQDLLQEDSSIEDLLNDRPSEDNKNNSDGGRS